MNYENTILALGAMGVLMLIQLLIADLVGIKSKHLPGSVVSTNHSILLFRVTRTVANTNESIAIFILAVLFGIFSGAQPIYMAYVSWGFVASRIIYAVCYYTNQQILRSITFGVSLLCLLGLFVVGFGAWV